MGGSPQSLSSQDIQDLQEIASRLPQGHPMVPKISTLLNSQPTQFEQERTPGYRSPEDTEFANTIGLKPTDIKGVTDAAMLGVGGAGIGETIAARGLKVAVKPLIKGVLESLVARARAEVSREFASAILGPSKPLSDGPYGLMRPSEPRRSAI